MFFQQTTTKRNKRKLHLFFSAMVHLISAASRSIVKRDGSRRTLFTCWSTSSSSSSCNNHNNSSSTNTPQFIVNIQSHDSTVPSRRTYVSFVSRSSSHFPLTHTSTYHPRSTPFQGLRQPQQQPQPYQKHPPQKRYLSSSSKQDFYKTLGVQKGDDKGTIKKAYFKLAKKYHPDTNKVGLPFYRILLNAMMGT